MAGEKHADDEALYQADASVPEQDSDAPPHAGSASLDAAIEPDVDRGPEDQPEDGDKEQASPREPGNDA
jgi:hypothetical protein